MTDLPWALQTRRAAALRLAEQQRQPYRAPSYRAPQRPMPRQLQPYHDNRTDRPYRLVTGNPTRETFAAITDAVTQSPQERQTYMTQLRDMPRTGRAPEAPVNLLNQGFEMTGLPSVRRATRAASEGDFGQAALETGNAAMGLLPFGLALREGAATRGLLARGAPEVAASEVPNFPMRATRPPGRASDGSVLPVRERQPFRQAEVGGSADLAQAARMRPDAGSGGAGQSRWHAAINNEGDLDTSRFMPYGELSDAEYRAAMKGDFIGHEDVPLSELRSTQRRLTTPDQPGVYADAYDEGAAADMPEVYRAADGRLYVMDGHHRAIALMNRGDTTMRARMTGSPARRMREFPDSRITTSSMTDDGAAFFGNRFGRGADDSLTPRAPDGGAAQGGPRTFNVAGHDFRVDFSPMDGGGARVDFGRPGADGALSATNPNDMSGADARRVFREVERAIRADAQSSGRAFYTANGGSLKQAGLYDQFVARTEPPPGYVLDTSEPGYPTWRRTSQAPAVSPREPLASSVGGVPIPGVVRRDFQRLTAGAGRGPQPSRQAFTGPGGKLAALSRTGAREMTTRGPRIGGLTANARRNGSQSAIDPRVIMGAGALGMFPTGAATAALVKQNADQQMSFEQMAQMNASNRGRLSEIKAGGGRAPYINPGRADPNRTIYTSPGDLDQPNLGSARHLVTGRPLFPPADAPRDKRTGRFVAHK